jgi:hypothetical protein
MFYFQVLQRFPKIANVRLLKKLFKRNILKRRFSFIPFLKTMSIFAVYGVIYHIYEISQRAPAAAASRA